MKVEPVLEEFARAALGHGARSKRLVEIARGLMRNPAASFPQAAADDAALEGTYRFLNNPEVEWTAILEPHFTGTVERIDATDGPIVVVHDTTEAQFSGNRDIGRLRSSQSSGFFVHAALAVHGRIPLGLLGIQVLARDGAPKARRSGAESFVDPDKESTRWWTLPEAVRTRLGQRRVVHAMDRGADSYELFSKLMEAGEAFVIRCGHDRRLAEDDNLKSKALAAPVMLNRQVVLSRRKKHQLPRDRKIQPPRDERSAALEVHATTVELRRPAHLPKNGWPPIVQLNVVVVQEVEAPQGQEPVQWVLLTNLPVIDAKAVETIVDIYRQRWMIEEYFKALKTGCAYESRQLESRDALVRALAILAPLAWRLFQLRALCDLRPDDDATAALTAAEILALRHLAKKKLPPMPTVREAFLAVAALGGHLKRNGNPGWMVLWKGWTRLVDVAAVLESIQESDQS